MYEVWSPTGLHLSEYDSENELVAMAKAARAAECQALRWIGCGPGTYKLAWPDGAARLYLIKTTPADLESAT